MTKSALAADSKSAPLPFVQEQLAYWTDKLAGAPASLELPTNRMRPAVMSHRGAAYGFDMGGDLAGKLRTLSQREGATLYMTLLSAFDVLLNRYSGQEDIIVGTPVANAQSSVPPNTLCLRTDLTGTPSFRELLQRVKETVLAA